MVDLATSVVITFTVEPAIGYLFLSFFPAMIAFDKIGELAARRSQP